MSATDELRHMLDERGVKWEPSVFDPQHETFYSTENGVGFIVTEFPEIGRMSLACDMRITPEQAIAATLGDADATGVRQDGASTCTLEKVCDGYLYFRAHECSECGTRFAYTAIRNSKNSQPNFCPNCGAKVVKE